MNARRRTEYLTVKLLTERYKISVAKLSRLRGHADPMERFPPPTIIQGVVPLWSVEDVEAYERLQRQRAPNIKLRGPKTPKVDKNAPANDDGGPDGPGPESVTEPA